MSAALKIPEDQMPANAEQCAELWNMSANHWLRTVACKPTFPKRICRKPATWIIGEVLEWRKNNRG